MSARSRAIPRRTLLGLAATATLPGCQSTPSEPHPMNHPAPASLPVLFAGHGSPMNALLDNRWSRAFRAWGARLPAARAVLAVSAHWWVPGTWITLQDRPRTIHDFGGFPPELHAVEYPAPGAPELARRIASLLSAQGAEARDDWGLDHGTWSVLRHLRPAADWPVLQLSLDQRRSPAQLLALGRQLAPLRREGVLVLASGNVVHNLRHAFGVMRGGEAEKTPAWALDFDALVASRLAAGDLDGLVRALESREARLAHPTPDHYLPLLVAAGAAEGAAAPGVPVEGFDLGSVSMRAAEWS